MSKRQNLQNLQSLFEANANFSLTETQYVQKTGANLPQNSRYIEKDSALSKFAKKYGFIITVKERTVLCEKRH